MISSGLSDPAERGMLDISPRAVSRMASKSIAQRAGIDRLPDVTVRSSGPKGLNLSASVTLPYPAEPLVVVLDQLRDDVAKDLSRQTGRAVERIDLRVERFSSQPQQPVRRVV
jgi:hypothetical protein